MRICLNTQEAYMLLRLLLAKESMAFYVSTMQSIFKYSIREYKFLVDIPDTWDCIYLLYGTPDNYIVLYKYYIGNKDLAYFIKKAQKIYPGYGF